MFLESIRYRVFREIFYSKLIRSFELIKILSKMLLWQSVCKCLQAIWWSLYKFKILKYPWNYHPIVRKHLEKDFDLQKNCHYYNPLEYFYFTQIHPSVKTKSPKLFIIQNHNDYYLTGTYSVQNSTFNFPTFCF